MLLWLANMGNAGGDGSEPEPEPPGGDGRIGPRGLNPRRRSLWAPVAQLVMTVLRCP